jgi:hypothetical protein
VGLTTTRTSSRTSGEYFTGGYLLRVCVRYYAVDKEDIVINGNRWGYRGAGVSRCTLQTLSSDRYLTSCDDDAFLIRFQRRISGRIPASGSKGVPESSHVNTATLSRNLARPPNSEITGYSISKVEATQTQGVMACNSIAMVVLLMLLQAKSPSQ